MTTPNEELMKRLNASLCPNKLEAEIGSFMQSQAERIKELESDEAHLYSVNSSLAKTNETLRAQLAEIEKTEPVAWRVWSPDGANVYFYTEDGDGEPLFTRPMPADVTELEKDAARYRWLRQRQPGGAYRINGVIYGDEGRNVDIAIDAAMAEGAK